MTTLAQGTANIRFNQLSEQHGLSNNHINAIIKDSTGFLWFGTSAGLNRYDGQQIKIFRHSNTDQTSIKDNNIHDLLMGPHQTLWVRTRNGFNIYQARNETFIRNADSVLKTYGIPPGIIRQIIRDQQGNYWFLNESAGLYRYNPQKKQSVRYVSKHNALITAIALTDSQGVQLIYSNGLLEKIDQATLLPSYQQVTQVKTSYNQANFKLFLDSSGDLWIYAVDVPIGVYCIKKNNKSEAIHIDKNNKQIALNTDAVVNITEDENENIWLATDHGGINLLNKKTSQISYLLHDDTNNSSIAQNSTIALYRDDQHIIWVGTYKQGVSYYHKQLLMFPLINRQSGLPFDDVNRFVEDPHGNLWIGTNGGGIIYFDRKKNHFIQYQNIPNNPKSLTSDIVVSMLLDKHHKLWIGTYYGGLNVFDGKTFKRISLDLSGNKEIQDNSIWELYQDSKQRIWVGTLSKGLYYYIPEKDHFVYVDNEAIPKYISVITEDRAGNLWVGGAEGIVVLNSENKIVQRYVASNKKNALSNNNIFDILQDKRGQIWIATQDGLNLYIPKFNHFVTYREANGLPNNTILNLLEDQQGRIWASTSKGICCLSDFNDDTQLFDIKNYHTRDGLQGLSFNENAALKTKKGELIFGGPAGFNVIIPNEIPKLKQALKPVITEFALFNRAIEIGKAYDGEIILTASPTATNNIFLKHDQNVFGITFSPLDYLSKEQRRFVYKLDGFHENWLPDEGNHKISFTNLDPGVYTFMVKASLENGHWSKPYSLLRIEIAPPFWKTPLAYLGYLILFISVLLITRHIERQRQKSRFLLQQEREETKRAVELDRIKTQFFTNISHEFRTPLSLIIAPIDKLIEERPTKHQLIHLNTMKRNAKRLLNLVNQLLDLKKVDSNNLKIDLCLGDIIVQLKEHVDSFSDLALKKHITLSFTTNNKSFYTYFDHEKLERIIFNLLGNAFKFTPENGKITVHIEIDENDRPNELIIAISDTGIGIPKHQQDKIFERYFQSTLNRRLLSQGNGIGLSITQEYVQLLGGSIRLESEEKKGSTFIIHLPIINSTKEEETSLARDNSVIAEPKTPIDLPALTVKKGPLILLVDDDDELVFYLQENLKHKFHIEHSQDANAAWSKILSLHPDLILSDIQMPGDTGIDLCHKVRKDSRTQHIPVILLTAYNDPVTQITATNTGASDYITKPFHFQLLISKIENQLEQKARFEKTYKKQLEVIPSTEVIESEDEKFLRKAAKITEDNISNTSFSVEDLAAKLNISRVGLYKRLLALNGHTPSEFIRNTRLRKAAQLLAKSNLSVSEIAYQVGFNNPKQFSKYFKAMYNVLPSIYKQNQ
ncbi:MAG TPA: two-component regulator propeller domain-containing protein [Pseudosphingobacterium sp.]|nr:two-component regulator propeller domain-containing protein [Pseudosphingobacterium sp.]